MSASGSTTATNAPRAIVGAPIEWKVYDTNARSRDKEGKPIYRIHEQGGRDWKMYFDEPCMVPEAVARGFLRDAAFKVFDGNGELQKPLSQVQIDREAPVRLAVDMVVAGIHELTTESLVTRAAMYPGGSDMDTQTPRPELIAFLIRAQRNRERLNKSSDGMPDGRSITPEQRAVLLENGIVPHEADAMEPRQLERILPDLDTARFG